MVQVRNVTVNLRAEIDASGNIEVFGQAPDTVSDDVLVADVEKLSAGLLYADKTHGVLEFWEPTSAPNTILGAVATVNSGHVIPLSAGPLGSGLQDVLNSHLDASGAAPFSGYSEAAYKGWASFGKLALAKYAHDLFGHVAATAAIDNDVEFIAYMEGIGADNAELGKRLADAIFALDATKATQIANAVIGQDAGRALNQDNNQPLPDVRQALEFMAGDVVYVTIALKAPTVSFKTSDQQFGRDLITAEKKYAVKITLKA